MCYNVSMMDREHIKRAKVNDTIVLGEIIQEIRVHSGLSQREFAKKYGITQRWLSEFENGKSTKATDKMFSLLRENGVRVTAEFEVEATTSEDTYG